MPISTIRKEVPSNKKYREIAFMEHQALLIAGFLGLLLGGFFIWTQQKRLQQKRVLARLKREKPDSQNFRNERSP